MTFKEFRKKFIVKELQKYIFLDEAIVASSSFQQCYFTKKIKIEIKLLFKEDDITICLMVDSFTVIE